MKKLMSFKLDETTRQRIDLIIEKLNTPKDGHFWHDKKTKTDVVTNAIARYYIELTTPAAPPAPAKPSTSTTTRRKATSTKKKAKAVKK